MSPEAPNLVVVCVDCLRQDFTGGEHADTPFFDRLTDRGIEYRELYATATTTSPCVGSLFTGVYSERHGINSLEMGSLSPDVTTMAELFSAAGYETAAAVTGPIVEETGLDRGFDHYWYREPEAELVGDWYDRALERLRSLSEPFLLYVHLWEVHEPVDPPAAFDDPSYGDTDYARALSALDRAIEEFHGELPADTRFVLTGDHGESLPWASRVHQLPVKALRDGLRYYLGVDTRGVEARLNRALADRSPAYPDHYVERGHGENAYDFAANVPLVLAGPGVDPATVDAQCRQVDVLPTLLDLAGLEDPMGSGVRERFDGESLLPPDAVEDRVAYLRACGASLHGEENWQRAVRADGYKYVEYPDRDWDPELYDLAADPEELRNVADERPEALERTREKLPDEELMDAERIDVQDRLRDLGYL